jgi:hypothetical protein
MELDIRSFGWREVALGSDRVLHMFLRDSNLQI